MESASELWESRALFTNRRGNHIADWIGSKKPQFLQIIITRNTNENLSNKRLSCSALSGIWARVTITSQTQLIHKITSW